MLLCGLLESALRNCSYMERRKQIWVEGDTEMQKRKKKKKKKNKDPIPSHETWRNKEELILFQTEAMRPVINTTMSLGTGSEKLARNGYNLDWGSLCQQRPASPEWIYCELSKAGLPHWLRGKETASNAGDAGLTPALERPPGEGNGNPLQCSCLGNPVDRGAWRATQSTGSQKLDTT